MTQSASDQRFKDTILAHLDSAHNLAHWLTRNDQDAQDVVQEAMLRAFKSFGTFRGGDGRAWLLAIVRNTCFSWLRANRNLTETLDDAPETEADAGAFDPQTIAARAADARQVRDAIAQLPLALRETLVLREMEDMSYKEVARITGSPVGTVMSRLSRARRQLYEILAEKREES